MNSIKIVNFSITLWWLILSATVVSLSTQNSNILCHENERQALLKFKQGITDPSNRLASWSSDDGNCCDWAGLVCHSSNAHILELHLRNPLDWDEDFTEYEKYERSKLGGEVSDALLNLTYLHHLDLSLNDFGGTQIPKFLGSLQSLRYLNLSYAGFGGLIPHQLGNLSNLHHLDLKGDFVNELYVESLQWLSGLSLLQHLDMSYVNMSKASNHWVQVTNSLSSLKYLHLSFCRLDQIPLLPDVNFSSNLLVLDLSLNRFNNSFIPSWVFSLSSLVSLNLHFNHFLGPIPNGFRNMSSLRYFDLSDNFFNSSLPSFLYSFYHLETLRLSVNSLQGTISETIGNLSSLTNLDLSYNHFESEIPRSLGNLCSLQSINLLGMKVNQDMLEVSKILLGCPSNRLETLTLDNCQLLGCLANNIGELKNLNSLSLYNNSISGSIPLFLGLLSSLIKLDLSNNQLSGSFPKSLGLLNSLIELDLSSNNLNGILPKSLGLLSSLVYLDLSNNQVNGSLPISLGQLSKLKTLRISHNSMAGDVSEACFANLTSLKYFWADENSLNLSVNSNWIPAFQLAELTLSSWHLRPRFPQWLRSQKQLFTLYMSNTGIRDTVPTWFWDMSSQFQFLDLSHNYLFGKVPYLFVDPLPQNFDAWVTVDLSSNQFEGPLPHMPLHAIRLDLSNNSFSGSLSHSLCYVKNKSAIAFLHLANNKISGELPDCWMNWQNLVSLELQNNNLSGNLPSSIGFLYNLQSLHLRNNKLSGVLPSSLKNCTGLLSLDLGKNQLVGSIPKWIGESFSSAMIISLRSNNFHGPIPNELCSLRWLKILDLAQNNLSGNIPKCFINSSGMTEATINSSVTQKITSRDGWTLGNFSDEAVLVMKGIVLEYSHTLLLVAIMDLSRNNLSGDIPSEITSLSALRALNLSGNHLTGKIPENVGNMSLLESLNLSSNQLCDEIPESMARMTFLSFLNLSYNNLTGRIPTSTQLQSFNASSFEGNNLCGPPISKNCGSDNATTGAKTENKKGHGVRVNGFYVSLAVGFVLGFWGVVAPLLYSRWWRFKYFQWLQNMWYKLCDVIVYCW